MIIPMNMALYRFMLKLGATEDEAQDAARVDTSIVTTKADLIALKADIAELKYELIKWNVGTIVAVAGIVLAIVRFTA